MALQETLAILPTDCNTDEMGELLEANYCRSTQPWYTLLLAAVDYNISDVYLMEAGCPLCNTAAQVGECD